MRIAIQFNPRSGFRACINHRAHVHRIRLALQKQSSGHVRDDVDVFIFRRADQPLRVFRLIVARNMQTCHDHVQFRQQFIRQNPNRSFKMSTSLPVNNRKSLPRSANFSLIFLISWNLLAQSLCVQTICLKRSLRVICDCPILKAEILHVFGNFFQACCGRRSNSSDCAANLSNPSIRINFGKSFFSAAANSPMILAQFRLDEWQIQFLQKFPPPILHGTSNFGSRVSSFDLNKPYSFSRKPRGIARWRITMLCSLLPVKYASANGNSLSLTTRKSH